MKILPRQAAQVLGISVSTLAAWERKGEISAIRTPAGRRLYDARSVARLYHERYLLKHPNSPVRYELEDSDVAR